MSPRSKSSLVVVVLCVNGLTNTLANDQITLTAARGASPEQVRLEWAGPGESHSVFRSGIATQVVNPSNKIGELLTGLWIDETPAAPILYFSVELSSSTLANVRDYGAYGNGVSDDAAAIQSALDSGLPVYLPTPAIAYLICGGLTVTQTNQSVFGDGPSSIIRACSPSFNMIMVEGASNVEVRDLQLQGAATSEASAQFGIVTSTIAPPDSLSLIGIRFSGQDSMHGLNSGIKVDDGADKTTVSQIFVERLQGTTSGHGYGVLTGAVSELKVLNSTFLGSPGRGRHAIYLSTGVTHSTIAQNTVDCFNEEYITLNSLATQEANSYNVIANNVLVGATGCEQNPSSALISIFGKSQFNTIIGNMINSSMASGIVINASSGAGGSTTSRNNSIIGNTIRSSQLRGIDILGATGTRLLNNIVDDSSLAAPCAHANIRLVTDGTAAVDGTIVLGNTSTGANPRSAFQINSSSPVPTNTVIKGNHFPMLCVGGVELNGVSAQIDCADCTGTGCGCS